MLGKVVDYLKKVLICRPESRQPSYQHIALRKNKCGISKESICRWCYEFQKECQAQSLPNPFSTNEADIMKENLRLRKELAEKEKEISFLKKRRHSLQGKLIRGLSIYKYHR